jgi:hypothetical protein
VFRHCPPEVEKLAEDYCLDRLDSETAEAFEDHYLDLRADRRLI